MKQLWFGMGLLVGLLLLSVWTQLTMAGIHYTAAARLESAGHAAQAEDWDEARSLAGSAQDRWQARRNITAALADQTPMDEVDMLFAELEVHAAEEDAAAFCAACGRLSRLLKAVGDAHAFSWQSLL